MKAAKKTKRKPAQSARKSPAKAKSVKVARKAAKPKTAAKTATRKIAKKAAKSAKSATRAATKKAITKKAVARKPAAKAVVSASKGAARAVPIVVGQDTLKTRRTLKVGNKTYAYYSIKAAEKAGLGDLSRLPYSLKVLLENLLRYEDGRSVTVDDIKAVAKWLKDRRSDREIAYRPARVLMQDFTGVPAVVDLAAMRDAMAKLGRRHQEDQSARRRSISSSTTR